MKRSLLALAVFGAFAGSAVANPGVTLYGIADAGVGVADTGVANGDTTVHVFSGVQSTSRLGVRGSEDLGGGLKAMFNIEAGVDLQSGSTDSAGAFQRRAVVGVGSSSWGEVRLGRDYTPGFAATRTTDLMSYGLFGNWLTFAGSQLQVGGATFGGLTQRGSNGLHYTSPTMSGLTVRAMYATGESDGVSAPKDAGDMWGLSGVYELGSLTMSGYFQSSEQNVGAGTVDSDEYGFGSQYKFGNYRVAGNYAKSKADGVLEHKGLGLGLGVKVGVGEVLVNYVKQDVSLAGVATDWEGKSIGLAYTHPLSKRTNVYASYGSTSNSGGGLFPVVGQQSFVQPVAGNDDPRAVAVGVRHMF